MSLIFKDLIYFLKDISGAFKMIFIIPGTMITKFTQSYFQSLFCFKSIMVFINIFLISFFYYKTKKVKCLFLVFLITIVCDLIVTLSILNFDVQDLCLNKRRSVFFIIIQLAFIFFMSLYDLIKSMKYKKIEQQFENTKLYNKSLLILNEQAKGIKHDIGNIVQAISGYLILKEYDGAMKYCNSILHDFNSFNILSVLSPSIIDEPAIYGIIARKKYIAEEKGVLFDILIETSCKNIDFPLFELTRSIAILLDNALEATLESKEKRFWINIKYVKNINSHIIVIGNSVKNPDSININRMFEKESSTKKIHLGIGLYQIVKFMEKNKNGSIQSQLNKKDKTFTQTLIFKKEN